jgi:glycosidase
VGQATRGKRVSQRRTNLLVQVTTVTRETFIDVEQVLTLVVNLGRDGSRTPMPWVKEEAQAGCSQNPDTWLPIPVEYLDYAVD